MLRVSLLLFVLFVSVNAQTTTFTAFKNGVEFVSGSTLYMPWEGPGEHSQRFDIICTTSEPTADNTNCGVMFAYTDSLSTDLSPSLGSDLALWTYATVDGQNATFSFNMTVGGFIYSVDNLSAYPSVYAYTAHYSDAYDPRIKIVRRISLIPFVGSEFSFTLEPTTYPIPGVSPPQGVYIGGKHVSGSRVADDTNTFVINGSQQINVTLELTDMEIASFKKVAPISFVFFNNVPGMIDDLRGAPQMGVADMNGDYGNDQVVARFLSDGNYHPYTRYLQPSVVTIDKITMFPGTVLNAYNNVTFSIDFANHAISIVSPSDATFSAYGSDYEDVAALLAADVLPRTLTSAPFFWSQYQTAEKLKNTKLTIILPDRDMPYKLRSWATVSMSVIGNASNEPTIAVPFVFPCEGIGNEVFAADCTTCDPARFDELTATIPLVKSCGQCIAGQYGPFCQYTSPAECSANECNGYGKCSGESRECDCQLSLANPFHYRFGPKCQYDQKQCVDTMCDGYGVCSASDPDIYSGKPNNKTHPWCLCGELSFGTISVSTTRKSHASRCLDCPVGVSNLSHVDCELCEPGRYGYLCQYSDANECVLNTPDLQNCGLGSPNGECVYISNPMRDGPFCNCSSFPENTVGSIMCGDNTTVCGADIAIGTIPTTEVGRAPQYYCVTGSQDCSLDLFTMNYARLPASYCQICPDNFTYTVQQSTTIVPYTCTGCIKDHFGPWCNYTDDIQCGVDLCNGVGKCAMLPAPADSPEGSFIHGCICNVGQTGYACETTVSAASDLHCNGNGTVTMTYNGQGTLVRADCNCSAGHFGPNCNMTQLDCSSAYCSVGTGVICSQEPVYPDDLCDCTADRWGPLCVNYNADIVICNGNGVYSQVAKGTWQCNCTTGFTGSNCELTTEACSVKSCNGHGSCLPCEDRFSIRAWFTSKCTPKCACDTGFYGIACENIVVSSRLATAETTNNTLGYADFIEIPSNESNPSNLTDFGSASSGNLTTAQDIIAVDMNAGASFVFTSIVVQQTSENHNKFKFQSQFKRIYGPIQLQTGEQPSSPNLIARCSLGTTIGPYSSGMNMSVAEGTIVCVDFGVVHPVNSTNSTGCLLQSGPGYVNASLLETTEGPCNVVTITEIASNISVTVVASKFDAKFAVGRVPLTNNSGNTAPDCASTINTFLSPNGTLLYVVGRNCSQDISVGQTRLFIDIWEIVNDTHFNFVVKQHIVNPYILYDAARAIWAPQSKRLIIRTISSNWNMLPYNEATGLFEPGFIVAKAFPGTDFDPWKDDVIYDSPLTVIFSTFGKTSTGVTVAFPVVVNVTEYQLGHSDTGIRYLAPARTGELAPASSSLLFSNSKLQIARTANTMSMLLVGGRVVLSIERIVDASQPSFEPRYVSALCSMAGSVDLFAPQTSLCSDYETQLDNGEIGVNSNSNLTSSELFHNPLLQDTQFVIQQPYDSRSDAHIIPMYVFVIRPTVVVSFAIGVSNVTNKLVTKRIEEINMTIVDPTITNCTRASFVRNGTMFVVTCRSVVVFFSVHPRSSKLNFVTKHVLGDQFTHVVSTSEQADVIAVSADTSQFSRFRTFSSGSAPSVVNNTNTNTTNTTTDVPLPPADTGQTYWEWFTEHIQFKDTSLTEDGLGQSVLALLILIGVAIGLFILYRLMKLLWSCVLKYRTKNILDVESSPKVEKKRLISRVSSEE